MKRVHLRLFLACLGTLGGAAVAVAGASPSGHALHPPMPGQEFTLQCRLEAPGQPGAVEVPVKLASPTVPAQLDQVVELPAPLAPVKITEYLPRAKLRQDVVPDDGKKAPPAILLSVKGPTQSYDAWLVANDPGHNRLLSLIGTWRYMVVADARQRDELFGQFEKEMTREPRIIVSRGDRSGRCELPLKIGEMQTAGDLGCRLRVRSFYHHFAMDDKTHKPVNQSDKRLNPAAMIEIEEGGKTQERWIFAKFPEFAGDKSPTGRFQVVLDCPLDKLRENPDFAVVTVGGSKHEVWQRSQGKTTSKPAELGKRFEVTGSQYYFSVTRFVSSGTLVEEYLAAETKDAVPALRIETAGTSGAPMTVWLESGKTRVLPTAMGPMTMAFGHKQAGPPPKHP